MFGAMGVLSALVARQKTGKGEWVDTSLLEAGMAWSLLTAGNYFAAGDIQQRSGSTSPQNAPYQAFETRDGFITMGSGNERLWIKFCEILGIMRLTEDPRFTDNASRVRNQKELEKEIAPVMKQKTTAEWLQLLDEGGIPAGPIYDIAQAVSDPQALSRRMVVEYAHPKAGRVKTIGFPIKFSREEFEISCPPPLLGEHNREILSTIGSTEDEIRTFEREGVI
jgi:crotonobetainyl-CoA:carnitine CoA-transferase CaiB-like acyl-CoA transferase